MRSPIVAAIALIAATAFIVGGLPTFSTGAQEGPAERLAALETRVAELETTVDEQAQRLHRLEEAVGVTVGDEPTAEADDEPDSANLREMPRNTIPIGEEGRIGNWLIEVREVNLDATDAVREENEFQDTPAAGNRFVLIRIGATYASPDEGQLAFDVEFQAIAESGAVYDVFDDCGMIPDRLDLGQRVSGGGTLVGNLCYEVAAEDVDSLVLYVGPGSQFAEHSAIWFSLHE
jgi:hypothetical protein